MAEDRKQEFQGTNLVQNGDHNQQHLHIQQALVQAAPLSYEKARTLVRAAIETFVGHLPQLEERRHSLEIYHRAEQYVQEVEQVTQPLVEALAQGALRMPDEVLSPEVEALVEAVLEFEGLKEFHGGNTSLSASLYPLYLIALGLLGAGMGRGFSGARGLLTPSIKRRGRRVPWVMLLGLVENLNKILSHHPQGSLAGVTPLSDRAREQLFGRQGWLRDVLPSAGALKSFEGIEALLGMVVFGAKEIEGSDSKGPWFPLLLGRYLYHPDEAGPLLERLVNELSEAQVMRDWFPSPQGVSDLYARYLSELEKRAGW